MNDPGGVLFPLLATITPQLKSIFAAAYVSVPPATSAVQPRRIEQLKTDEFFRVIEHDTDVPVGEDFLTLYARAAFDCPPDTIMHLAFIDRVAFALQTDHQAQYIADIQALDAADLPCLFQRTDAAWATHPQNYYELEQMLTRVGELLLGRRLDFAWCHLVTKSRQLQVITPRIEQRDLAMMAELLLLLGDGLQTREVDWLAWEDPFITGRDATELKHEREHSQAELHKRLGYIVPMMAVIRQATR
jgi:hypothetical protein